MREVRIRNLQDLSGLAAMIKDDLLQDVGEYEKEFIINHKFSQKSYFWIYNRTKTGDDLYESLAYLKKCEKLIAVYLDEDDATNGHYYLEMYNKTLKQLGMY